MFRPQSLTQLIDALQMLPGVGPRTARRMADAVLSMKYDDALELSRSVLRVKKTIVNCNVCRIHTERNPCDICSDPERDHGFVCVVESSADVEAFEKAGSHHGTYHVLGGLINTTRGVGPEKIAVRELIDRVSEGKIKELLIATDTSVDGDATADYIRKELAGTDVRITRPARGIPVGADLDYLDGKTLQQAFNRRSVMETEEQ